MKYVRNIHTSRVVHSPGEFVDDACVLAAGDEYLVLLGHARDHEQVSWFRSRDALHQVCRII